MQRHATLTPFKPIVPETAPLQGYVTRAQVAQHFKVAECTIAVWQRRDLLPVHRIGTQPVYDLAEVDAWFAARPNCMHGGVPGTPEQEALLNTRYSR